MIGYWVGFAETGVPAQAGQPEWQDYSAGEAFMRFADEAIPGKDPVSGMFELNEEVVARRRHANQQWFLNVGVASQVMPDPESADSARRER
jgi:para-nitrobenzyl esterase